MIVEIAFEMNALRMHVKKDLLDDPFNWNKKDSIDSIIWPP